MTETVDLLKEARAKRELASRTNRLAQKSKAKDKGRLRRTVEKLRREAEELERQALRASAGTIF
jgi:hypothetical protein